MSLPPRTPERRARLASSSLAAALLVALLPVVIASGSAVAAEATGTGDAIVFNASGPASPYPSTATVTAPAGEVVTDVDLYLDGLSHPFSGDLDLLLVAPDGTNLEVLSDAGNLDVPPCVETVDLVFDDDAPRNVPAGGCMDPGNYRPSDYPDADPDDYPAPAPAPSDATTLAHFNGTDPNGDWQLFVVDDFAPDGGSLEGWSLDITTGVPPAVTIPGLGPADPYPSTYDVTAPAGSLVTDVDLHLDGLQHTWVSDLDLLLVAPDGTNTVVMSDSVYFQALDCPAADLVFDDQAEGALPYFACPSTGTFRPGDYDEEQSDVDDYPEPAPAPSETVAMANFVGVPANGTWRLFIVDDVTVGLNEEKGGTLDGWSLDVTTEPGPDVEAPETTITSPAVAWQLGDTFSYTFGSSEPGSTFECRLDTGAWTACTSPHQPGRAAGTHVLSVRATDEAGNTDQTPATTAWTVPYDDRQLTAQGRWKSINGKAHYRGTARSTTTKGASLVLTPVRARDVRLIVTKCQGCGTVNVFAGNKLLTRVSLAANRTRSRVVVPVASWPTLQGAKTLRIVVVTQGKPVSIDGLGVRTL